MDLFDGPSSKRWFQSQISNCIFLHNTTDMIRIDYPLNIVYQIPLLNTILFPCFIRVETKYDEKINITRQNFVLLKFILLLGILFQFTEPTQNYVFKKLSKEFN